MRRLLLLPLLAPLLAVLLTAALNPRPSLALRLLTWTTPALPIGAWIAAMAGGGAALSAGATALALRSASPELRRRVQRAVREPWEEESEGPGRNRWADERAPARPWRRQPAREPQEAQEAPAGWDVAAVAGPARDPGQPAPTIAVPYRVIRRPADRAHGAASAYESGRAPTAEPEAVPAWQDDWNDDDQESW